MPIARLATLLVCAAAALGCADEVTCEDGVEVDITTLELEPGTRVLTRVCLGADCHDHRERVEAPRAGRQTVYVPVERMPAGGDADVDIELYDDDHQAFGHFKGRGFVTVTRPNGDDRPPECRAMLVRLEDLERIPWA